MYWSKMRFFHHSPSGCCSLVEYCRYLPNPSTITLSFVGSSCASSIASSLPLTCSLPSMDCPLPSNEGNFRRFIHHRHRRPYRTTSCMRTHEVGCVHSAYLHGDHLGLNSLHIKLLQSSQCLHLPQCIYLREIARSTCTTKICSRRANWLASLAREAYLGCEF